MSKGSLFDSHVAYFGPLPLLTLNDSALVLSGSTHAVRYNDIPRGPELRLRYPGFVSCCMASTSLVAGAIIIVVRVDMYDEMDI